ncbi:MAG: peptide deformylase [Anaerolineales bacterium]|jgi:peptide deformylase
MTTRNIVTPPNPTLRQKARSVRTFDDDLQILIDDMVETMREANGVGLAAPQVDVSQRVIVIEYAEGQEDPEAEEEPNDPKLYILVNPEITRQSIETVTANEACLSLPGYFGEVERFEVVTVKGQNRRGDDIKLKAQGWLARVFQHEIDHLDGILYIDRATDIWKIEPEDTPAGEGAPTPSA